MEVKVRDKRTGEEKAIPVKVYEALKHKYIKLGDNIEGDGIIKKKEGKNDVIPAEVKFEAPVIVDHGEVIPIQNSTDEATNNDAAEYEQLSGKKPDGRWSAEKLKVKLEELKNKPAEDESK